MLTCFFRRAGNTRLSQHLGVHFLGIRILYGEGGFPFLSGTCRTIFTSLESEDMNESTSNISAKSLQCRTKDQEKVLCCNKQEGVMNMRSDLASFQKDSSSSFGMTSVAFSMRAATTASMIWKSDKQQNFPLVMGERFSQMIKSTNHHSKTNDGGREDFFLL